MTSQVARGRKLRVDYYDFRRAFFLLFLHTYSAVQLCGGLVHVDVMCVRSWLVPCLSSFSHTLKIPAMPDKLAHRNYKGWTLSRT